MIDRTGTHRVPICPSCGRPAKFGLFHLEISNKVKALFSLLLIGYVTLSVFLLLVIMPPEMRRGCGIFDSWQRNPVSQTQTFASITS